MFRLGSPPLDTIARLKSCEYPGDFTKTQQNLMICSIRSARIPFSAPVFLFLIKKRGNWMVSRGEGWGVRDSWLRTLLTRTIVEFSIQTLGLIGVLNPSSLFAGVPDKSISIRANICTILSILLGPITMLLYTSSGLHLKPYNGFSDFLGDQSTPSG